MYYKFFKTIIVYTHYIIFISLMIACSFLDVGTAPDAVCLTTQDCRSNRVCVEGQCKIIQEETCDGIDNDFDTLIDEQVTNSCGLCGDEAECEPMQQMDAFIVCDLIKDPCCNGSIPGNVEICDGIDNDCDGTIDEDFLEQLNTPCEIGVGECRQVGTVLCVTEDHQIYATDDIGSARCQPDSNMLIEPMSESLNNSCDGLDNDCDGFIDEEYIHNTIECDTGACSLLGQTTCLNGMEIDSCRDVTASDIDQTCDGVDDDCNGRIDEDYIPNTVPCGLGVCTKMITVSCLNGVEQSFCQPLEANPQEIDNNCDGLDNDCDGNVDEAFTFDQVTCGRGACQQTIEARCVSGRKTACEPLLPNTEEDDCDGIDNDCDGRIDEDFVILQVTCGLGVCSQNGVSTCQTKNGQTEVTTQCTPLISNTSNDLCDGIDNDCDGNIDEDHVRQETSCGLGICYNTGFLECESGEITNSCLLINVNPEESDNSCNYTDDDCDGLIDEGYIRVSTACMEGSCAASSNTICQNGNVVDTCRVSDNILEQDSTCDGIDDDCDGNIDENYEQTAISCGQGVCVNEGLTKCVNGTTENDCHPYLSSSNDQSCDGLDNDCDGAVDESFIPIEITCGVGVCKQLGYRICQNAEIIEQCEALPVESEDTQCDRLDNDCDGVIDEGYVLEEMICGRGVCSRSGVKLCVSGGLIEQCISALPNTHLDTTCDGQDNDCDGDIDEDYISHTINCGVGACYQQVQSTCQDGVEDVTCIEGMPIGEDSTCNQIDEDCDGILDEGFEAIDVDCLSCGESGQTNCTPLGISDTCTSELSVQDHTCDGVDDDCDGVFDENYTHILIDPVLCGMGECSATGDQLVCRDGVVKSNCKTNADLASNDNNCDGLDNDCDGDIDESFISQLECGVGMCQNVSIQMCIDQEIVSECLVGDAGIELCGDGLDNDCDGNIDEGFELLNEPCSAGIGACQETGVYLCNLSEIVCSVVGEKGSSFEICNGFDDDCDDLIDEKIAGVGEICTVDTLERICLGIVQCDGTEGLFCQVNEGCLD